MSTAADGIVDAEPSHDEIVATQRVRQNFGLAVPAGLAAAAVGAIGWAVFGYLTGSEFGLIAIAIGALVGLAIRRVGNGVEPRFGYLGAACSALGWALGTVMCDVAFLAKEVNRPVLDTFASIGVGASLSMAVSHLEIMDAVFLAIAMWEGYKFSMHRR